MRALFICENLMKLIKRKEVVRGSVHSVFSNACNIETEHEFITLLSSHKAMAPMSVVIGSNEKVDFYKLNLNQKKDFIFSEESICCRDERINISLEEAQLWYPEPVLRPSPLTEEEVLENINVLELGLYKYGSHHGISPIISILRDEIPELQIYDYYMGALPTGFSFIKNRFIDFINAFVKLDEKAISVKAKGIIGFGVGLTPAADDFISGMMLSLVYLGYYYNLNMPKIYEFNQVLISKCLNKTTKVSSEMLKYSALGKTNQTVRELIKAILYQCDNGKIIETLVNTIKIGATSGSDMALGIYIGNKIITNLKYRGGWSNEFVYSCEKRQLL